MLLVSQLEYDTQYSTFYCDGLIGGSNKPVMVMRIVSSLS